jgi:hypothetical protein
MGAINTGDYANDSFIGTAHRPADPVQKERIKQLVARAEKLENAELARNPDNIDMLYARGVTRGQFAIYTALIGAHRTRLVLLAPQCGWGAPRPRTRS